jgi:hypothetical protein
VNELTVQFAEQAAEYAVLNPSETNLQSELEDGTVITIPAAFIEQFAELIVRECALIAGLMEHDDRGNIGAQILDRFEIYNEL